MTIPQSHPRLWFTSQSLATARQWFQSNPFTPAADDPVNNALAGLLGNNATFCRRALDWALGFTISASDLASTSSDNARWFGEQVVLAWDWCYGHMSGAERTQLMDRWNTYNNTLRQKPWGGPTMYANNYHWGYLRNELSWAISSYGENSMADTFFQDALVTRWQSRFVPYAMSEGTGGIATEGSQYGKYLLGYASVPFRSVENHGRQIFNETDFYKSAVFALIYGVTPDVSTHRGSGVMSGFEVFPYGDDQFWRFGRSAHDDDYGTFMTIAALRWANVGIGRYARQWLNQVQPPRHRFVAAVDTGSSAQSFSDLPLDYYASGPGTLFTRTNWGAGATSVHLMLGDDDPGTGHHQDDWGFQVWRGGRWLTRETTAYADAVAGYAGATRVQGNGVLAHNGIIMNGTYVPPNEYRQGPPRVIRLHSTQSFSYAATDLTSAYRAPTRPQNDNPAVANVVREFVFIRPFETLIVLDRLASNAVGTTSASNVAKAFLIHFENTPQVGSNAATAINGSQALRLITLAPANATYRVVDESAGGGTAAIAQYRLEVETRGEAESYFVHVLQARDASAADITARLTEDASTFRIALSHPTGGSAAVVFNKGMSSSGGTISIGNGSAEPLLGGVQQLRMTDNGPVWESGSTGSNNPGAPPRPTDLRIIR